VAISEIMTEQSEYKQKVIIQKLKERFDCSDNTIKQRLDSIIEENDEIIDQHGDTCNLLKNASNGKPSTYQLVRIDEPTSAVEVLLLGDLINS
jgi:hypothetical protein